MRKMGMEFRGFWPESLECTLCNRVKRACQKKFILRFLFFVKTKTKLVFITLQNLYKFILLQTLKTPDIFEHLYYEMVEKKEFIRRKYVSRTNNLGH